jgi:site-specific DNA-methyltransferase (adenine-specific)
MIELPTNEEPIKIINGDCLEVIKQIPDSSITLIVVDSPYYRIMLREHNGNRHDWDNQWDSFEDYLNWCRAWFLELKRILKNNGSLYIFQDDKLSAYFQIELEKIGFYLENNIIWVKPNNMTIKGWNIYTSYAPITERILFFSKQQRTHNLENEFYSETIIAFKPIIEYMIEQKRLVKKLFGFKTDEEFNQYINKKTDTKSVVSRHYFTYSQWVFPTKEIYERLQDINNEVFKKEYEVFKKEYEVLLRYFEPKKNYTDVWTFNITSSSDKTFHPTQKPEKLIRRIIDTSSKEGDLCLDLFSGSGTTSVCCKQLKRKCIGIEISKEYCDIAKNRLAQEVL